MEMKRPLPESYWVVPGHLLAGEYPAVFEAEQTRQRIDALLEAGFDKPGRTRTSCLMKPKSTKWRQLIFDSPSGILVCPLLHR
jgi:hypothetical protein